MIIVNVMLSLQGTNIFFKCHLCKRVLRPHTQAGFFLSHVSSPVIKILPLVTSVQSQGLQWFCTGLSDGNLVRVSIDDVQRRTQSSLLS